MWKVQLFKLNFDEQEVAAVANVVRGGWLTMGEKTQQFEAHFAAYLGDDVTAAAVANGTAALHLALLALQVGLGDEVIIPSLTFVADINSVLFTGANPVVADCTSLDDWNIDPHDIEHKISPRTKAVMIVHYAGYPCAMDEIVDVCKRHRLALIEDVAHAPGARYHGRSLGTFGDCGCFSFFTNKNLSVGEGGMVTTTSVELDRKIRYLRSHGMTSLTLDRHQGRATSYDVVHPGLNYRIDEIRAALGLVQLAKLPEANRLRQHIVARYITAFRDIPELKIPFLGVSGIEPAYHIFPVLLPKHLDRMVVIERLKQAGVQSSIHYPAFQEFTAFAGMSLHATPIANEISRRELTLPLYPAMSNDEVSTVIKAFRSALKA